MTKYKRTKQHIENNVKSILNGYRSGKRKPVFLGEKRPEHSVLMKEYYRTGRMKSVKLFGKNNPSWKGDNVSYFGLHHRVKKERGKPNKCEICDGKNSKRFEWAMINNNWFSLCISCHRYIDGNGKINKNRMERLECLKKRYSEKSRKISKIIKFLKSN